MLQAIPYKKKLHSKIHRFEETSDNVSIFYYFTDTVLLFRYCLHVEFMISGPGKSMLMA